MSSKIIILQNLTKQIIDYDHPVEIHIFSLSVLINIPTNPEPHESFGFHESPTIDLTFGLRRGGLVEDTTSKLGRRAVASDT